MDTVKVKLTNGELFNLAQPLNQLMAEKFPVRTSYALAKLGQKLQEHLKVVNDVRNALIKKHGSEDPETKQFGIKPNTPEMTRFGEELAELFAQEIEVEVAGKVKLPEKVASTCDKCKHNMEKAYEVEAGILLALDKFIEVG